MPEWIEHLNSDVLSPYCTRLIGGYREPFYKAPVEGMPAEIRFTCDYERSALHELAHWCIAGEQRRKLDDFGYWYEPDGRTLSQQHLFFNVEIRPQAIEKHFCDALEIYFEVSADNLGNFPQKQLNQFSQRVYTQYTRYLVSGFPSRANKIYHCLCDWYQAQNNHPTTTQQSG